MAQIISLSSLAVSLPGLPTAWSFSSAKQFGECPRKWMLNRLDVPRSLSVSALEGILLHDLLTEYSKKPEDFKPRKVLEEKIKFQKVRYSANSRVCINTLIQKISRNDILNLFNRMFVRTANSSNLYTFIDQTNCKQKAKTESHNYDRKYGREIAVKDPASNLVGRIDYIDHEGLVDFKSGEFSESHTAQVLLYAALWMERWNEIPTRVTVVYSGDMYEVSFSKEDQQKIIQEWRVRIKDYDTRVRQNDIAASPTSEKCGRCHIRALCPDYWEKIYVAPNFSLGKEYCDYVPSSCARAENSSLGVTIYDKTGDCSSSLFLDGMPSGVCDLKRLRILGVRIENRGSSIQLRIGQNTEIFCNVPDILLDIHKYHVKPPL